MSYEKLYKCCGPNCPGLPFRASDLAHQASCNEASGEQGRAQDRDEKSRGLGREGADLTADEAYEPTAWQRALRSAREAMNRDD